MRASDRSLPNRPLPLTKETEQMNSHAASPRRVFGAGLATLCILVLGAAGLLVATASADVGPPEFGLSGVDGQFVNQDGSPTAQAGSHPYALQVTSKVNYEGEPFVSIRPYGEIKDILVEQIPGIVGDARPVPTCPNSIFGRVLATGIDCPKESMVGLANVTLSFFGSFPYEEQDKVYLLEAAPGEVAKLGFNVFGAFAIVIDVSLNTKPPYNPLVSVRNIPQTAVVIGNDLELWGVPASPAHDAQRGGPVSIPVKPFLTLPRACEGPLTTSYETDSWQNPGVFVGGSFLTHDDAEPPNPQGFTGCGKLPFKPELRSKLTSESGETGSGLDLSVDMSQEGLLSPDGLAQSDVKKAVVTLPEGVTINPSVAEGLGVCTPTDYERETLHSVPGEGCPNASRLGSVRVESPLVDEAIDGSVFLAQQDDPATVEPGAENPFDSLIALYMVMRNTNLGGLVKVPIKVEPDPQTGQLVATMDDIPQVPFNRFSFHFREGQRAPLITPAACGTYTTEAVFTPRADPSSPRTVLATTEITEGAHGGPCPPAGTPPFEPRFEAGSINNNAGSFSPFNMRLLREDGDQDMTKFSAILPPGVVGSLRGMEKCSDAEIAAARAKTGREELAAPSCPAGSEIGHTLAGAGVGSALTYVGGKVYLGGPYRGDPLSVVAVTPAVAGPFDAGTVVVQLALNLNPQTAEVEVDGANSEPIPHILKGIVLKLRDLRVHVDRPDFTLNPTSCDESSARATLFGAYLNVFDPADDVPVDLSTRYQAANCLNLGFEPHLGLKLKGGTRRGGHPGLRSHYRPTAGDANLSDLVVRLPRSAFLDQSHIRTICTRVQFAADACPKAAQYGYIRAWTPLLDEPLQGPVWLRSSNHKLPDLVFDLHGLVDVEVQTRIDSVRGGIRARVEDAPDAPISRVLLNMQGGKKGLIVNSRNLCVKAKRNRASAIGLGQNGKRFTGKPVMQVRCGRKAKRSNHRRAGRARVARASAAG